MSSSSSNANAPNSILDGTNMDFSVITYSAPKPYSANGKLTGKVVNVYNAPARESLSLSAPMMGAWGAQEAKDATTGESTGKYTMSLQFSGGDYATPESTAFLENMKALQQKIKEDAMIYSKEWFGKDITNMDVMEEKFNPMLRYPKKKGSEERDYSANPTLTLKIPCWKGVWQTSVFDEEYNPLYVKTNIQPDVSPLNFLTQSGKAPIQVICLIQCGGIWIANGKASITWNLKQVIVRKPRTSTIRDDTCFLMVRPTELEALKQQPETEPVHPEETVPTIVEDSDDEYALPPPPVAQKSTPAPAPAPVAPAEPPAPVAPEEPVVTATEPAKKRTVVRKKKE